MGKKKTKKKKNKFRDSSALFVARFIVQAVLMAALMLLPMWLLGFILPGMIDDLTLIRGALLFVTVLLLTAILSHVFRKKDSLSLISFPAACFIEIMFASLGLLFRLDYAFIDLGFSPLWVIPLIISLGASLFFILKCYSEPLTTLKRIGYILLCTFIVHGFIVTYAFHLNYALDFSPPEEYSSVIVDKDRNTHIGRQSRKLPTTYEFTIVADGKKYELAVTRDEYYRYDEGDTYDFYRYEGALGEPFFLSKMGK